MTKLSGMFKLSLNDTAKGLITAALAGAGMAIYGVVSQSTFDVFSVDWNVILHLALNGAIAGFMGYMTKNFFTASNGKVFGKI